MKLLLYNLICLGLFSCAHVGLNQNQQVRDVSSQKSDDYAILNPVDGKGFIKVSVGQASDLAHLRELLIQTLDNEVKIASEQKLNKDFFKSVKWASKLCDQLVSLNPEFSELKKNPLYINLQDILQSLKNRWDYPFDKKVEVLALAGAASKATYHPEISISNRQPVTPLQIEKLDVKTVANEISRPHLLPANSALCIYDKAKDGWGYKPGFKVLCGENKFKIKFGNETLSGPFNSRVYRSLGFLTPKIDVIENFKMKYDRRLITEFNSQKAVNVDVKVLGIKVKTIETKQKRDPFSFIKSVSLKNGNQIDSKELKARLIDGSGKFDESFEDEIDAVEFVKASITEPLDAVEVGPWSFEEGHHQQNPQVRQGIILAAWVGNSDIHSNNNRLVIEKTDDKNKPNVHPIFIDVGYGLGATDSAFGQSSSDIRKMNWTISSRQNEKVILSGFVSQKYNSLLTKLQFEDATGALQTICRLSADQIHDALTESGATPEEADMGTKKLLQRRSQLIKDLGIENEFKACFDPQ